VEVRSNLNLITALMMASAGSEDSPGSVSSSRHMTVTPGTVRACVHYPVTGSRPRIAARARSASQSTCSGLPVEPGRAGSGPDTQVT
jgi:hypothetical protein